MKGIWSRVVLLLLLGAAVVWTWTAGFAAWKEEPVQPQTNWPEREAPQVKVVAHRGGAAHAPENTLAALARAIAAGANLAEIDLRMTKDGGIIALHDETLTRTTGSDHPVSGLDMETVRTLDAGGWFSAEFQGEPVPTLTELLEAARGKIRLMLELKHTQSDQTLLERTVEQIRSRGMEEACVLACGDLELLRRGKELAPELENVYIGESLGPELWEASFVDGYSINFTALTAQNVEQAHQKGRAVYAWTVNERQDIAAVLELGVDGLVTDDPDLALELLKEPKPKPDLCRCVKIY